MKHLVLNLDDDPPKAILGAFMFAATMAETNLISAICCHGFPLPHAGRGPNAPLQPVPRRVTTSCDRIGWA
jgi:hypothetical protein